MSQNVPNFRKNLQRKQKEGMIQKLIRMFKHNEENTNSEEKDDVSAYSEDMMEEEAMEEDLGLLDDEDHLW